jgi:hypothetical protein
MSVLMDANTRRPAGYDSIVLASDYAVEGVEDGSVGCHYDYRAQTWREGHDHAHVDAACLYPPVYCGADVATCQGYLRAGVSA